jgi:hypothetical protein
MAWTGDVSVESFEPTRMRGSQFSYLGKCCVKCQPWVFYDVIITRTTNGPHVMMPVRPMVRNNEIAWGEDGKMMRRKMMEMEDRADWLRFSALVIASLEAGWGPLDRINAPAEAAVG